MEFELRPWRMEDVEAVARYANNLKVAANLRDIFPYPYTRQDAEEFLQSCIHVDPSRQCFRAIVIQGEAAGSISLSFGSDSTALRRMILFGSMRNRSSTISLRAVSWKRRDFKRRALCDAVSINAAFCGIPIYMHGSKPAAFPAALIREVLVHTKQRPM